LAFDKCETKFSAYNCWERGFGGKVRTKVLGEGVRRQKMRRKGLIFSIPGVGETL